MAVIKQAVFNGVVVAIGENKDHGIFVMASGEFLFEKQDYTTELLNVDDFVWCDSMVMAEKEYKDFVSMYH